MSNVAIYIRTSTTDQNPENQLNSCLSINKFGKYEIYKDQQSAWQDHKQRNSFNKLKSDIKNHLIIHLICWDLDRLYRNRKNLIAFFKFCNYYKCHIHSYRQDWLEEMNNIPSPWNEIVYDMMLNIMGWIAQDESDKKSQRVKEAIRFKDGKTISYKGNKWGRKGLSKKTILKVLELHNSGKSIRQIASEVIHYDSNNNVRQISVGSVHKIITNFQLK